MTVAYQLRAEAEQIYDKTIFNILTTVHNYFFHKLCLKRVFKQNLYKLIDIERYKAFIKD